MGQAAQRRPAREAIAWVYVLPDAVVYSPSEEADVARRIYRCVRGAGSEAADRAPAGAETSGQKAGLTTESAGLLRLCTLT